MKGSETVLNVRDFQKASSRTSGIQEAIDALPRNGGTVHLPPGKYLLRRSVRVRSNLRIRGDGVATVVTRPPMRVTTLTQSIKPKQTLACVKDLKGMRVGDEIYIGSDENHGWHGRHGVIQSIKGSRVELELLDCLRDRPYSLGKNPIVANWFPAFHAVDENDFSIENLTIDGNIKKHKLWKTDFVVAAVHTRRCTNLRVLDLTIRDWPSDGIGIQGGEYALIRGCIIQNVCGHGLHPGTGATHTTWVENVAKNNTRDGFFFCQRVTHCICKGNQFTGNRKNGIGDLSNPDRYNVVSGNVCAFNREHGIHAARAFGNTIEGNVIRNNSLRKAGDYAAIYLENHQGNIVRGNVCVDDQVEHTQLDSIREVRPAGSNIVADNPCFLTTPRPEKKK